MLQDLRAGARKHIAAAGHRRTADNLADLMLGIWGFLDFAKAINAISEDEYDRHFDRATEALTENNKEQGMTLEQQNPALMFVELIAAAVRSGRAYPDKTSVSAPTFDYDLAGFKHIGNGDWRPPAGAKQWLAVWR